MKAPKMIDNKRSGTVADELRENIRKDSKLSIMTAYFTIYAFESLKKELFSVVRMSGYDGDVSLEMEDLTLPMLEGHISSLRTLKEALVL